MTIKIWFSNAYAVEISVFQQGNRICMFRFLDVFVNSLYHRPRTELQRHRAAK